MKKLDKELEKGLEKEFQKMYDKLPENEKKALDEANVKSFADMMEIILGSGVDLDEFVKEAFSKEDADDDDAPFDMPEGDEDIIYFVGGKPVEYHIRMKLNNSPIPIWREVKVPSNISLEFLALIINYTMGWQGYHMHQFVIGNDYYETTEALEENEVEFFSQIRRYNANNFALSDIFKEKGKRIKYEYDFGDGWEHDVWLKGVREYENGEEMTLKVVKGVGMDPLEDCGGVWGLEEIINSISKKRRTAEEKETLKWYGIDKDFDIEYFDKEFAQESLDELWDIALINTKE